MASEAMMKVQLQARENAVELNDYLKDLDSWREDIKKKDKTFKDMKPQNKGKLVPPVRSGIKPKEPAKAKVPQKRLRSYDYNAWDKLDVDKMMEEVDEEEEVIENIKKEEKAEKLEKDLLKLSLEEKEKGNNHFKSGSYQKALDCYTKGMQYDPSNAILPANRAMTYLKLKKWVETEADCTLSLSLDPCYVKAYLRRGTARMEMGKVGSAERDFKDALKIEPDNKQAANELKKIENMGKKEVRKPSTNDEDKEKKPSFASRWKKSQRINAVIRPYNRRSSKPMRRIAVQEIGNSLECYAGETSKSGNTNLQTREKSKEKGKTLIEEIEVEKFPEVKTNQQQNTASEKEVNAQVKKPDAEVKPSPKIASYDVPTLKAKTLLGIPPAPKLSSRFRADLIMLKPRPSCQDDSFQYLQQIKPSSLSNLVKNDLDADLLELMVSALKPFAKTHSDFVLGYLHNISFLKRFKSTLMCLEDSSEQDLKDIFENLSDKSSSTEIAELRKIYKCC